MRETNGTLVPISGNGFTTLNSMGMSVEARAKALEVWRKNKK